MNRCIKRMWVWISERPINVPLCQCEAIQTIDELEPHTIFHILERLPDFADILLFRWGHWLGSDRKVFPDTESISDFPKAGRTNHSSIVSGSKSIEAKRSVGRSLQYVDGSRSSKLDWRKTIWIALSRSYRVMEGSLRRR